MDFLKKLFNFKKIEVNLIKNRLLFKLQVKKLKESPNEMWFEVTVESSDFKEKKKEYNYIVKGKSIKKIYF
ncbi:hypothetical protein EfmJHP38_32100 (plasmid) [Enterococcus faecium]|nr:hypothetical protein EfmJHP38_32100 [Enterococcus faecium]